MQDRIGHRDNALRSEQAGSRTKEGQEFGGASPLVLMRLQRGVAFGLEGGLQAAG